jgi:DNA-binding MarR family transcriptional regulator
LTKIFVIDIIIITMIFNDDLARFFELAGFLHVKTRRAVGRALAPLGITTDQYGTLVALQQASGLSQRQLAAVLETDTTTAMVICEGLESRGMITRKRNPKDRRSYNLVATDKGKKALGRALPILERLFAPWQDARGMEDIRKAIPIMERAALKVGKLSAKNRRHT